MSDRIPFIRGHHSSHTSGCNLTLDSVKPRTCTAVALTLSSLKHQREIYFV